MAYLYSRREVIADAAVHAIGVAAATTAAVGLGVYVAQASAAQAGWAVAICLTALLSALIASAVYHLVPLKRARPWLRRIDHAATF